MEERGSDWMGPWWDTVRQMATMTLIATILDLLMPSGSMKKYARLVSGLVLMLLLLRPIAGLFIGGVAEGDIVARLMDVIDTK